MNQSHQPDKPLSLFIKQTYRRTVRTIIAFMEF